MCKHLIILTLFLLLVASCSPTPTLAPASPIPSLNVQNTNSASPVSQSDTATVSSESTPTLTVAVEPTGSLSLQVLSPQDEAIVNTPHVDVSGSAPAGAVVSVNEEILIVGSDGQFKTTVTLEEGPNLIEVIASDINGNESSLFLTVTYES